MKTLLTILALLTISLTASADCAKFNGYFKSLQNGTFVSFQLEGSKYLILTKRSRKPQKIILDNQPHSVINDFLPVNVETSSSYLAKMTDCTFEITTKVFEKSSNALIYFSIQTLKVDSESNLEQVIIEGDGLGRVTPAQVSTLVRLTEM